MTDALPRSTRAVRLVRSARSTWSRWSAWRGRTWPSAWGRLTHGVRRGCRGALDLLFPPACVMCSTALPSGHASALVCPSCEAAFVEQPADMWRCRVCAAPMRRPISGAVPCPYCEQRRYRFTTAWVLGDYQGLLREAVLRTKRSEYEALTMQLGRLLGARLVDAGWQNEVDVVVPVPSHWWRRWSRGVSGPELLADAIANRLQRPLWRRALRCQRRTQKQGTLTPQQRWDNVRGAFAVRRNLTSRAPRVLLVDDVLTTGATLNEATRALLRAGAREVRVAVLARGVGPSGDASG